MAKRRKLTEEDPSQLPEELVDKRGPADSSRLDWGDDGRTDHEPVHRSCSLWMTI